MLVLVQPAYDILMALHPDLDVVDMLISDHREALATLRAAMGASQVDRCVWADAACQV